MNSPKRHLYIVSGSSRGLGLALARELLASPEHQVLGIARRDNEALYGLAASTGSVAAVRPPEAAPLAAVAAIWRAA